jgi:L-threonylcarbamoyladenylate synthase
MSQACPPAELARRLAVGEPVLFPTDTLPALAAAPAAAAALWRLKQRPGDKPLILMGADLAQLLAWLGDPWPQAWLDQARRCWPGAVTLVLPITGPTTEALHPGGASLGLRVPACDAARALLRLSGPLATTSANRSGEAAATSALEAATLFPALALLAPVPWAPGSGQASTVLAWNPVPQAAEGSPWRVLRGASAAAHPSAGGGVS